MILPLLPPLLSFLLPLPSPPQIPTSYPLSPFPCSPPSPPSLFPCIIIFSLLLSPPFPLHPPSSPPFFPTLRT